MRKTMTVLLAMVSAAAAATEGAADVAVRPGLWEIKLVRQYMDGRDVTALVPLALSGMQQMMGGMTPQQRKEVEATLGTDVANANTTQRICVSPEMANGDKPLLPAEVKCQPTAFNRGGNRVTFEFSCADQGHTTTGRGTSILTSETATTQIDMVTNDANGRHKWQNHTLATFIADDCGTLRPADQVTREAQPAARK